MISLRMGGLYSTKALLLISHFGLFAAKPGQGDENETVVYLTWIPSHTIFYGSFIC